MPASVFRTGVAERIQGGQHLQALLVRKPVHGPLAFPRREGHDPVCQDVGRGNPHGVRRPALGYQPEAGRFRLGPDYTAFDSENCRNRRR
jgi:hypothetical protein